MAEDLDKLIGQVGAPVRAGNVSSADPVLDVQNKTTVATIKAQQTIDTEQLNVADEMRLLQQQTQQINQNTGKAIRETQMRFAQTAQQEKARIQDDTANLRKQQEVLQANLDGRMEEYKNTVANGNFSFFANPITYVRDQYRINYQTERLNKLAGAIRAVNSRVDAEYAEGAQRLRELREGSFAMDYMSIVQNHRAKMDDMQIKQLATAQEYERNAEIKKSALETHALAQQLRADPRGADGVNRDKGKDAIARYMYVLQNPNGDITGYDSAKHRESMYAIYETKSPAEKAEFARSFGMFNIQDTAGQTPTATDMLLWSASNKDYANLLPIIRTMNSPQGQQLYRTVSQEVNAVADAEYVKLEQQALASMDPKAAALAKTEGLPAEQRKALREQALENVYMNRSGDVMQSAFNRVGRGVATKIQAAPVATLTSVSSEAMSLMEQNVPRGIGYDELAYFQSDDFKQLNLGSDPDEHKFYGEFGGMLRAMEAGLLANGAKKENVATIIATYVRSAALANQLQDPGKGQDVKTLIDLGLTSEIPINVTALQEGTGLWNALFGRYNGPQFDAIRGKVSDMTDPGNVQHALELMRQYERVKKAGVLDVAGQVIGSYAGAVAAPVQMYGEALATTAGVYRDVGREVDNAVANQLQSASASFQINAAERKLADLPANDPTRPSVEAKLAELRAAQERMNNR